MFFFLQPQKTKTNYNYYPAFEEYPGSVSLRLETARDLMIDICRSLARYGPHKFYALNTGISTITPLKLAAKILGDEGIQLRYSDLSKLTEPVEAEIKQEEGGTHADEIETSMMLVIAPSTVDMSKAVKDYHPSSKGGLTRNPKGEGSYSASGVFGDATLATREKGELLVKALPDITKANPALLACGTYYVAEIEAGSIVGCGGWTAESPGSGQITQGEAHVRPSRPLREAVPRKA